MEVVTESKQSPLSRVVSGGGEWGGWRTHPLHLAFRAREGVWLEKKPPPSVLRFKQGRKWLRKKLEETSLRLALQARERVVEEETGRNLPPSCALSKEGSG